MAQAGSPHVPERVPDVLREQGRRRTVAGPQTKARWGSRVGNAGLRPFPSPGTLDAGRHSHVTHPRRPQLALPPELQADEFSLLSLPREIKEDKINWLWVPAPDNGFAEVLGHRRAPSPLPGASGSNYRTAAAALPLAPAGPPGRRKRRGTWLRKTNLTPQKIVSSAGNSPANR